MGDNNTEETQHNPRFLWFPDGRLIQLMNEHGVTRETLCRAVKASPKTVGLWRISKRRPFRTKLEDFLTLFKVETERELYGKIYDELSVERKDLLTGSWSGNGKAKGPGSSELELLSFKVHWKLHTVDNDVYGQSTITFAGSQPDTVAIFNLKGGFLYSRYCRLTYETKDGSIRFGSIVVELDTSGKALDGCYTGFSVLSNTIVYGTVNLLRDARPGIE